MDGPIGHWSSVLAGRMWPTNGMERVIVTSFHMSRKPREIKRETICNTKSFRSTLKILDVWVVSEVINDWTMSVPQSLLVPRAGKPPSLGYWTCVLIMTFKPFIHLSIHFPRTRLFPGLGSRGQSGSYRCCHRAGDTSFQLALLCRFSDCLRKPENLQRNLKSDNIWVCNWYEPIIGQWVSGSLCFNPTCYLLNLCYAHNFETSCPSIHPFSMNQSAPRFRVTGVSWNLSLLS